MKIACLGWGSLVWDSRELPIRGKWFEDGPILPIEFLRTSREKHLTLVINEELGTPVRTLWTLLDCKNLNEAKDTLCFRESGKKYGQTKIDVVDFILLDTEYNGTDFVKKTIYDWAIKLELTGVVWTGLTAKFNGNEGEAPRTSNEALHYLKSLNGVATQKAEEYIRKAPKQIATAYRKEFTLELGWN